MTGETPSPWRYTVVVPVYNEADNIGRFCRRVRDELPPAGEVLLCYDFYEDTTLAAVAALPVCDVPPGLRLVHNTLGQGVRYAIEAGMRAATAPIILVMMADLSDDFARVEEMVTRAERGAAVVCASRYMPGGAQRGGPPVKKLLSRLAGLTLHWFAGIPTHDSTNSFKAYRRDYLSTVTIESSAGFSLGLELTVKAHFSGRQVDEIPATWWDRTNGQSRFRLFAWLPVYLRWYIWALHRRWIGPTRRH